MPPAAIYSISASGTAPLPFHIAGVRQHADAAGGADQRERVHRVERVLRDVGGRRRRR